MTMYKREKTDLEHAEERAPGTIARIHEHAATIAASLLHAQADLVIETACQGDSEALPSTVEIVANFATHVAVAIHRELSAIVSPRGEQVTP